MPFGLKWQTSCTKNVLYPQRLAGVIHCSLNIWYFLTVCLFIPTKGKMSTSWEAQGLDTVCAPSGILRTDPLHKLSLLFCIFILLFCTMTNKCTIISQIIILVHIATRLLLVPRSWKSRAVPIPTLWATPGL